MTTLNELEELAKAASVTKHPHPNTLLHQSDVRAYRSAANPDTILQMIALIRQLGDALKEAETAMVDHGTAYLNHEDEYSTGVGFVHVALNALKEFDK